MTFSMFDGSRKKAHWKKAHRKNKRTGKKRTGKKRIGKRAHAEKSARRKKRSRKKSADTIILTDHTFDYCRISVSYNLNMKMCVIQ